MNDDHSDRRGIVESYQKISAQWALFSLFLLYLCYN